MPRLVNTWITPPTALEPYRLETLPRTISTRSTWSSMMCCSAVKLKPGVLHAHAVDQDQRARAAGRRAAQSGEGTAPMPPVCAISNPASLRSRRGQVDRLRVADLLFGEHGGVRNGVAQALLGARRGDDHGIFLSKYE